MTGWESAPPCANLMNSSVSMSRSWINVYAFKIPSLARVNLFRGDDGSRVLLVTPPVPLSVIVRDLLSGFGLASSSWDARRL